ncbi:hypothetical protein WICMUC_001452 [Wickerhamomyces mucosus]|uniref:Uncharacterized protein n=1 Tax=Wickerhamomyces mucosus TaxID=1378264 RepID=A0A9P8PVN2_9ASCO|nr:hypothetical protein WICMUC_001452 [Wickerhamomyces mucosus]
MITLIPIVSQPLTKWVSHRSLHSCLILSARDNFKENDLLDEQYNQNVRALRKLKSSKVHNFTDSEVVNISKPSGEFDNKDVGYLHSFKRYRPNYYPHKDINRLIDKLAHTLLSGNKKSSVESRDLKFNEKELGQLNNNNISKKPILSHPQDDSTMSTQFLNNTKDSKASDSANEVFASYQKLPITYDSVSASVSQVSNNERNTQKSVDFISSEAITSSDQELINNVHAVEIDSIYGISGIRKGITPIQNDHSKNLTSSYNKEFGDSSRNRSSSIVGSKIKDEPQKDHSQSNEIINLSIPESVSQKSNSFSETPFLENFNRLSVADKTNRIENILKLVAKEIPTLSENTKPKLEAEINHHLTQLNKIKEKVSQSSKFEGLLPIDEADRHFEIQKLEKFLKTANETKRREDEQEFRESRAYEWSKIMSDKNSRTFNKGNFFCPVDEELIKRSNKFKNTNTVPLTFEEYKDDLFFPKYQSSNFSDDKKTYITISTKNLNEPPVSSETNPFGSGYKSPALLQLIRELSEDSNYNDLIKKIDKLSTKSWKLIGIGHSNSEKVLVFEREIDRSTNTGKTKFKTIIKRLVLLSFGVTTTYYVTETLFAKEEVPSIKN